MKRLLLFTLLLATPAFAEGELTRLEPRVELGFAFSQAKLDTDLRVDAANGTHGTGNDVENDYSLAKSRVEPRAVIRFRPSRRHELEAGYQMVRRTAETDLTTPVRFGDATFDAATRVRTHIKSDRGFVTYRWAAIAKPHMQAGPAVGVGALFLDAEVVELDTGRAASKSVTGPVGSLGAYGRFQAGARWTFEADLRWLHASLGGHDGSLFEAGGAARWHLSEKVGFELGYAKSIADLDVDGAAVRYSIQNLRLGLVLTP